MKLGKLLAAGKSIMNGRADVSYRANKQIYLPKFGSAKNPFKTEATPPSEETTGNALAQAPQALQPSLETGKASISLSSTSAPQATRLAKPEAVEAKPVNVVRMAEPLPAAAEIKQKKKQIGSGSSIPLQFFTR
jgi:hypothetical protein